MANSDSYGGSVKFYYGNKDDVDKFINRCSIKWESQIDKPLHCLFTTNQMVASYSGFLDLYFVFKDAEVYKGIGYQQLNTELLNHDTIHLGKVQSLLYRITRMYTQIRNDKQPLRDILPTSEFRYISYSDLKNLLDLIKAIDGNTLEELLNSICNSYISSKNKIYRYIVEALFDIDEDISTDSIYKFFANSLYYNIDDDTDIKSSINNLLNIKLDELLNWFHYINRDVDNSICYHTIHSTKGLEYENVVIILDKDFGTSHDAFESYFRNYGTKDCDLTPQYEIARNILYVAITRTIKNLRIFYVDNIDDIHDNIVKIFGDIKEYRADIRDEDL